MSRGAGAGVVTPIAVTQGGTGAQDAEAAREALGIPDAITSGVSGQANRYTTLAALNAVTSSGSTAIAYVEGDGTNDGSYRANGSGGWTRYSTATISSLNSRTGSLEANYIAAAAEWPDDNKEIVIASRTADGTAVYSVLATDRTGSHAGKADFVPHPDAITRVTASVQAQVTAQAVVTDIFVSSDSLDNEPVAFGVLNKTSDPAVSWWGLRVVPTGPDKGKVSAVFDEATKALLGSGTSIPTSLFGGTSVAPTLIRQVYRDDIDGWPEVYAVRGDGVPTVAVGLGLGQVPAIVEMDVGQSNSAAGGGDPAVTTSAPRPRHGFMPNTGPSVNGANVALMTDLAAAVEGTVKTGETPVSAGLRWSIARELADLAVLQARAPHPRIGFTAGLGGQTIAQISKGAGTGVYEKSIAALARVKALAGLYGIRQIWVPALPMDQGEADRSGTSFNTYVARGITLQSTYEADIQDVTRSDLPLWIVQAQLGATSLGVANAWTAVAQERLIREGTRWQIAMPGYFFQGTYGRADTVHFLALGHALRAEYKRKALRIVQRRIEAALAARANPWSLTAADISTCLRPDLDAGVWRSGADIYVGLILPADGTAVVEDTTTLPLATNKGFNKSAGAGGAISSVDLVTNITNPGNSKNFAYGIKITLASAGGATIDHAYTIDTAAGGGALTDRSSAWGNFRDNCDEDSIAVSGLKLRNWLVTFQFTVS